MYGKKSNVNKKFGVILIVFVVLFFTVVMAQGENKITSSARFLASTECFEAGECITTYKIPDILSEEELKKLTQISQQFIVSNPPEEYVQLAQRQVSGQRDLASENIVQEFVNTTNNQQTLTASSIDASLSDIRNPNEVPCSSPISGSTYKVGSIVCILGKITTGKPPPYFFNVNITCCEMPSFNAMSTVETQGDGSFIIKIPVTARYPLGEWTVTISTIGDLGQNIKKDYHFTLVI